MIEYKYAPNSHSKYHQFHLLSYHQLAINCLTMADAAFAQADTNHDQRLDRNEFGNFLASNLGGSGAGYGSSSYESSSFESSSLGGAGFGGASSYDASASYGAGLGASSSSYGAGLGASSSSYDASASYGAGFGGASSYDASASYGAGFGASADLSAANYSASSQTTAVQQYPTDAQGLFRDSNPQIIRRPAQGGVQTYTQNIRVRFLQPPPLPPPGVC